jgi:hypothetical protein
MRFGRVGLSENRVELASFKRAGRALNELELNESNPRAPVELNRASRVCVAS